MLGMSRPAWLRHVLAAVAWVCLGTQLSALTHFLVVEHVRCAEHGDLIHAHEQHEVDADEEIAHLGAPPLQQCFTPSGEADDHDHDHCLISSERREPSVLASTPSILASTSTYTAILSQSFSELVLASRVYAFAPKTSPPMRRSDSPKITL